MSDQTKIEWADSTFNPWIGCTHVSPACDHCYAENMMDTRLGRVQWGAGKPRLRTSAANWRKPVQWNGLTFVQCRCGWRGELLSAKNGKCPACAGVDQFKDARRRVFCASLADVFDNEVDPQWRADLFRLIRETPNLDWLLLTKRIGNAAKLIDQAFDDGHLRTSREPFWPWPNVWLGATVVNQDEADRDIPKLLATPAAVRFISVEPMLGPVNLTAIRNAGETFPRFNCLRRWTDGRTATGVDWVICGGESGKDARPMHPGWVESLRDQCAAAGVAFFMKQMGGVRKPFPEIPADLLVREFP